MIQLGSYYNISGGVYSALLQAMDIFTRNGSTVYKMKVVGRTEGRAWGDIGASYDCYLNWCLRYLEPSCPRRWR